jgi:hypothetical protein
MSYNKNGCVIICTRSCKSIECSIYTLRTLQKEKKCLLHREHCMYHIKKKMGMRISKNYLFDL